MNNLLLCMAENMAGRYMRHSSFFTVFASIVFNRRTISYFSKIFFGLLVSPVEDLGFVMFVLPNWQLLNGLGRGTFSSVFSCRSSLTNEEDVVVKIFSGNMTHMAVTERTLLTLLSTRNTPTFRELYSSDTFHALLLTQLGVPVLPCLIYADVTPSLYVTLLQVVQHTHSLGWIHRDIKPGNVFLDK